MDVEKITDGEEVIAIIVRKDAKLTGNNFFSQDSYPLQFGVNLYESGYESRPHVHLPQNTTISNVQEMLHIDSGMIELDLFTESGRHVCRSILTSGDSVFFASGGHGVKIIEPTKIIEIKQGPYFGAESDKRYI